ncbi:MAG: YtxH domain-containing protein [Thermodesulfovibrionales bacterium]|jgi:gas vesicle protein
MTVKKIIEKEAVCALAFGGLISGGAALLIAPRSGRETRQRIVEFERDVKARAECHFRQAEKKVRAAIERGRDFVQEKKSIITTAAEAAKEAYKKEHERLSEKHRGSHHA